MKSPLLYAAIVATSLTATARADGPRRVTIRGTSEALGETPLVVELGMKLDDGDYSLEPGDGGNPVPATAYTSGGKTTLALVLPKLGANAKATYTLRARSRSEKGDSGV